MISNNPVDNEIIKLYKKLLLKVTEIKIDNYILGDICDHFEWKMSVASEQYRLKTLGFTEEEYELLFNPYAGSTTIPVWSKLIELKLTKEAFDLIPKTTSPAMLERIIIHVTENRKISVTDVSTVKAALLV